LLPSIHVSPPSILLTFTLASDFSSITSCML
jgi:hypothetical protein